MGANAFLRSRRLCRRRCRRRRRRRLRRRRRRRRCRLRRHELDGLKSFAGICDLESLCGINVVFVQ